MDKEWLNSVVSISLILLELMDDRGDRVDFDDDSIDILFSSILLFIY